MKYWTELTRIEDAIIRLQTLDSLVRVVASGIPQTNLEDASNSIWHLQGSIESIHADLRDSFDELWEMVRDEDKKDLTNKLEKKYNGGMKKKKMMTDKELP